MECTGIICEYNPLHLGHARQIAHLRRKMPEEGIVCLMSGNFVQRGKPAVFDKLARARAAVLCGADLVLELPLNAALSSAEGFASRGVGILSSFCQNLCFGAETADPAALINAARALLDPAFSGHLRTHLDAGLSFPAARQRALGDMGLDAEILTTPNNILAVEYCKAILAQGSALTPLPIVRPGSYHDTQADRSNPSATALRALLYGGGDWCSFVPQEAAACFENQPLHRLQAGESAMLYRLRTMTEAEFEALPYGSEGLWRKLMHAARRCTTVEEIAEAVKSKRYTRTRIDRMLLCAFLGLTAADLAQPAPYVQVLAFNDRGRQILRAARETGRFPNIGEAQPDPWQEIETRAGDLYGLFCLDGPEPPGREARSRVYAHK